METECVSGNMMIILEMHSDLLWAVITLGLKCLHRSGISIRFYLPPQSFPNRLISGVENWYLFFKNTASTNPIQKVWCRKKIKLWMFNGKKIKNHFKARNFWNRFFLAWQQQCSEIWYILGWDRRKEFIQRRRFYSAMLP